MSNAAYLDSQQLFLNLSQLIANGSGEWPTDFSRAARIQVSRNSGPNISHVTLEFEGKRAKYLCCLIFNGTSDTDVSCHKFAMPGIKLTARQKAIGALSLLSYMIGAGLLKADLEHFKESFSVEIEGGMNNVLAKFADMTACSILFQKYTASEEAVKHLPIMIRTA